MGIYKLTNDFHNSYCFVCCDGLSHIYGIVEIKLSAQQTKRAWRKLCGIKGCTCADHECGIRGNQTFVSDRGQSKRIIVMRNFE